MARKIDASRLRHRLVVQGLVVTRRTKSDPLLQKTAAAATSRAPRRAADVAGSRRAAIESGTTVMREAQGLPMLTRQGPSARARDGTGALDRMCDM
jgi:hypothetical protein